MSGRPTHEPKVEAGGSSWSRRFAWRLDRALATGPEVAGRVGERAQLRLIRTIERFGFDLRRRRLIAIAVSIGVLLGIAMSTYVEGPDIRAQWGVDYRYFGDYARQWLDGRGFFLPMQIDGPYEGAVGIGNWYPPPALFLFVPFVWLPAFLWWAIPLGITAWAVWSWRPAYWTWPIIVLLLWLPRSQQAIIWGNTAMWMQAFVALGLQFAWPAALCLIKPSFFPFALIGASRRSWWIVVAVMAIATVPLLPVWGDYITAMNNNIGPWPSLIYPLHDYPFVSLPIIAWLGRQRAD
jgi:hypothetical protein